MSCRAMVVLLGCAVISTLIIAAEVKVLKALWLVLRGCQQRLAHRLNMNMIAIMQKAIVTQFDAAPVRHLRAGRSIFPVGTVPTVVRFVTSGHQSLGRTLSDGTELILHTVWQGEAVGEAWAPLGPLKEIAAATGVPRDALYRNVPHRSRASSASAKPTAAPNTLAVMP